MSILGNIMSSIFGGQPAPPPASPQSLAGFGGTAKSAAAETPAPKPAAAARPGAPAGGQVDVAAVLDKLAMEAGQKLDWRRSIVDLMKLLRMDSGLGARKKLAQELSYTGDMKGSAAMNVWLHKQVMLKLAENGGKVPAELKH